MDRENSMRAIAGRRTIEIAYMKITEAGRQALAGRAKA